MATTYAKHVSEETNLFSEIHSLSLSEHTLDIFGLDFSPADLDTFAAIRQDEFITSYAEKFRATLTEDSDEDIRKKRQLTLMKEAMDDESVAKKAKGAFQTVGSAANVGGIIPVVNLLSAPVAMVTDVLAREKEAAILGKQFYLLGPKMHEIAIKTVLEKLGDENGDDQ
ncbi:MAG: hypothetical protein OXR84_06255 [Magnetovibrio sp.]|nr:hypothetical protein [Magnetovibrio sp.]